MKNPLDLAVELLVFAPVGLALSARELLPKLVERGRQQVTGRVATARMIGQFAVQQGQTQAGKAFDRARTTAKESLEQRGVGDQRQADERDGDERRPASRLSAEPATNTATTARASRAAAAKSTSMSSPSPATVSPNGPTAVTVEPDVIRPEPDVLRPVPAAAPVASGAGGAGTLAIPAYDSLSASQVVPRLSGLNPGELEAVRAYESANRGRKTILNKVAQLQTLPG